MKKKSKWVTNSKDSAYSLSSHWQTDYVFEGKPTGDISLPIITVDFETSGLTNAASVVNIGASRRYYNFGINKFGREKQDNKWNRVYYPDFSKQIKPNKPIISGGLRGGLVEGYITSAEQAKMLQEEYESGAALVNKFSFAAIAEKRQEQFKSKELAPLPLNPMLQDVNAGGGVKYSRTFNDKEQKAFVKWATNDFTVMPILVMHNAKYDKQFINDAFVKYMGKEPIYLDTMYMEESTPELKKRTLTRQGELAAARQEQKLRKGYIDDAQLSPFITRPMSLQTIYNVYNVEDNKWRRTHQTNRNGLFDDQVTFIKEAHQADPDVAMTEAIFTAQVGHSRTSVDQYTWTELSKVFRGKRSTFTINNGILDTTYSNLHPVIPEVVKKGKYAPGMLYKLHTPLISPKFSKKYLNNSSAWKLDAKYEGLSEILNEDMRSVPEVYDYSDDDEDRDLESKSKDGKGKKLLAGIHITDASSKFQISVENNVEAVSDYMPIMTVKRMSKLQTGRYYGHLYTNFEIHKYNIIQSALNNPGMYDDNGNYIPSREELYAEQWLERNKNVGRVLRGMGTAGVENKGVIKDSIWYDIANKIEAAGEKMVAAGRHSLAIGLAEQWLDSVDNVLLRESVAAVTDKFNFTTRGVVNDSFQTIIDYVANKRDISANKASAKEAATRLRAKAKANIAAMRKVNLALADGKITGDQYNELTSGGYDAETLEIELHKRQTDLREQQSTLKKQHSAENKFNTERHSVERQIRKSVAEGTLTKSTGKKLLDELYSTEDITDVEEEFYRRKKQLKDSRSYRNDQEKYEQRLKDLYESGALSEEQYQRMSNMTAKQGMHELSYATNRKKLEDDIFNHRIHGRMTEADAERLKQIKSNQELARSIQEVVVKQHNAIQNWHKLSKIYDFNNVYQTGYAQFNGAIGAAAGVVPRFILNPIQRAGAAMINGFEIDRAKYNYWMRTANTIKDTAAVGAGIIGTLVPGGGPMLGALAMSGMQAAGQIGIAAWNNSLYSKERKFIERGQSIQNTLNTFGLLKSITGLDFALGLLAKSTKIAAAGITGMVVKGLHSMHSLGTPLTSLTGMDYRQSQWLGMMDRLTGQATGSTVATIEDFALQQRQLYTYGKYNTDRMVAASMLGVFSQVYANGGNPQKNYESMIDAIANRKGGITSDVISWASMIDKSLPRILEIMKELKVTSFEGMYNKLHVYYNPLTNKERDEMYSTSANYRLALAQTNTSMMRVGNAVWNNGLGGMFDRFNKWMDILAQKAGVWLPMIRTKLEPLTKAIDKFFTVLANPNRGKGELESAFGDILTEMKNLLAKLVPPIFEVIGKIAEVMATTWGAVINTMGDKAMTLVGYLSTLKFDQKKFLAGDPSFLSFGDYEFRPMSGLANYQKGSVNNKIADYIKAHGLPSTEEERQALLKAVPGAIYAPREGLSDFQRAAVKKLRGEKLTATEQTAWEEAANMVRISVDGVADIVKQLVGVMGEQTVKILVGDNTDPNNASEVPAKGSGLFQRQVGSLIFQAQEADKS